MIYEMNLHECIMYSMIKNYSQFTFLETLIKKHAITENLSNNSKGYIKLSEKMLNNELKETGQLQHPGRGVSLMEDRGRGGIVGEGGRGGWTNLIHLLYKPLAGAAAALWRTTPHLPTKIWGNYKRKTEVCCFGAGATSAVMPPPHCRAPRFLCARR